MLHFVTAIVNRSQRVGLARDNDSRVTLLVGVSLPWPAATEFPDMITDCRSMSG